MKISMKCSIAIHCLIFIYEAEKNIKVTSNLLSKSTGCNPVIIRNILSVLKKEGIITMPRGKGGAKLCADPGDITLYQIYRVLEPNGLSSLIGIHSCEEKDCMIAQNIRAVLQISYKKIEDSIRETMEKITLQSMIEDFHQRIYKV